MVLFGPGGNSISFREEGHKSTLDAPKWLYERGLNAYEYECGQGVRISEETAIKFGEEAKKYGITLSVHAPYFISLSSVEEEKRDNSIKYILDTLKVAKLMGAKRIVVHPGSCSKRDRNEAFELALLTMKKAVEEAKANGYGDIEICPETMGKINQLGSVEEIAKIMKIPKENVVLALEAIVEPVSLFEPVFSDGNDTIYVMDQIGDNNDDKNWLEELSIKDAIKNLSQREKNTIGLRFFQGKTQMEVANEIGISQAQVSRLEKNAIDHIKKIYK